jgi:TolA-binding protein
LFRRLMKEYPDSDRADDARLNLAESDYMAGRTDAAEREFRALESNPKSDELVRERALFQLIEINSERQRWDDVQKLAATFRNEYPKSGHRWSVSLRAAEADLALGKLEQARETLVELKSRREEPEIAKARWLPRVWVLLAETSLRLKKYDDVVATVEEFRQAYENSPVMHQALEVLGRSYKNRPMPDFAKAREAFQAVLDDPAARDTETAAKSQLMIAETYWLQKDYKQAQEAYLKVYLLYDFPQWQAPALFQAAACDEQLNQWSKAAKAYEELLQKFPESEMAAKAEARLRLARQKASAG